MKSTLFFFLFRSFALLITILCAAFVEIFIELHAPLLSPLLTIVIFELKFNKFPVTVVRLMHRKLTNPLTR